MLFLNHQSTDITLPWVFDFQLKVNIIKLYKSG